MLIYNKVNGKLWCCEAIMGFTNTDIRRLETNAEKCHPEHQRHIKRLKDNDCKCMVFGKGNMAPHMDVSSFLGKYIKNPDVPHYDIRGVQMSRENVIKYAL